MKKTVENKLNRKKEEILFPIFIFIRSQREEEETVMPSRNR